MSKFHINKNGVPAPCKAQNGKCPLGGETGSENHYDSQEEAQKAADEINERQHGLLPGRVSGDTTGELTKQEEFMRALRDPKIQYKLIEKKTEESRKIYETAEKIFNLADNPEDKRLAGYEMMKAERELKENEEKLLNKKNELKLD